MVEELGRFQRQVLLFGTGGQRKLQRTSVALVGCGGTGCHTAQQLAYLGVRDFALVDADVVTESSLNRLVGARTADVGTPKVEVLARRIRAIEPRASLTVVADSFVTEKGAAAMAAKSVLFGCVDSDGARLLLNEYACAYDKPYIDQATDTYVTDDTVAFGGRVLVSARSAGCLYCLDLLDPEEIKSALVAPNRRREEDEMYGVAADALRQAGPSVVSINGVVASIAVTEFMKMVTEVVSPVLCPIRYDGVRGIVNVSTDSPHDCPYCGQRGMGEAVDWNRHVRAGVGRWLR